MAVAGVTTPVTAFVAGDERNSDFKLPHAEVKSDTEQTSRVRESSGWARIFIPDFYSRGLNLSNCQPASARSREASEIYAGGLLGLFSVCDGTRRAAVNFQPEIRLHKSSAAGCCRSHDASVHAGFCNQIEGRLCLDRAHICRPSAKAKTHGELLFSPCAVTIFPRSSEANDAV